VGRLRPDPAGVDHFLGALVLVIVVVVFFFVIVIGELRHVLVGCAQS
jgi:hypothetical protein